MGVKVSGDDTFKAGKPGGEPKPEAKKTLSYNQGIMRKESAGLPDGISARENFNVDEVEPTYDYAVDGMTGNATERRKPTQDDAYSVSGKGKSFSIL